MSFHKSRLDHKRRGGLLSRNKMNAGLFLKAIGESNAAVLSNGKAGVPYSDAKGAIETGNNAIIASKASILYSAMREAELEGEEG